jgi:hypothetical protein
MDFPIIEKSFFHFHSFLFPNTANPEPKIILQGSRHGGVGVRKKGNREGMLL